VGSFSGLFECLRNMRFVEVKCRLFFGGGGGGGRTVVLYRKKQRVEIAFVIHDGWLDGT